VTLAGFVPHERIPCYLARAHLLLHSSRYEGQGVVFAEAAAAGVPICGTRVGLLHDLGDRFAALAEPGDDEGLAKAIERVATNVGYRSRLIAEARTWTESHTAEWTAGQYADVYARTISVTP